MRRKFPHVGFLLIVLIIILLFYGNLQFTKAQPGGTDFLYRWLPTRLVLFEGFQNPYSPETEYRVEIAHHGRPRQGVEPPGIFAYPYYTMGVVFPFALISDFPTARAAWMTLLELTFILIVSLTFRMLDFQPSGVLVTALIMFAMFDADFAQPLIDGNPSGLAALFAILSLYYISRKSDILAGVFLSLSTIKPQLVILFFVLIWGWAFYQKRWNVILSSAIMLAVLFGISFLFFPAWLVEFVKDLLTYPGVARPSTPRAILYYWMPSSLAKSIALGFTLLSIFVLFRVWRNGFREGFAGLFWAACITFTIMPLTGITSAKSNYITMLPGIILLIKYGYEKFGVKDFLFSVFLLVWIGLSWLFFYGGRNWVIGGNLIYFIDFYPMPVVLLILFYLFRNTPRLVEIKVQNL